MLLVAVNLSVDASLPIMVVVTRGKMWLANLFGLFGHTSRDARPVP
jgi:hypothetical protein